VDEVKKWLDEVENGTISRKVLNNNVLIKTTNSDKNTSYETYIENNENNWVHINMIKK
jgi:hypothetical protein